MLMLRSKLGKGNSFKFPFYECNHFFFSDGISSVFGTIKRGARFRLLERKTQLLTPLKALKYFPRVQEWRSVAERSITILFVWSLNVNKNKLQLMVYDVIPPGSRVLCHERSSAFNPGLTLVFALGLSPLITHTWGHAKTSAAFNTLGILLISFHLTGAPFWRQKCFIFWSS